MKFRTGSKVEVLNKKDFPCGSWRCGEIISRNGHYYDIRYDWALGVTDVPILQRVSRTAIRPSPPPLHSYRDWVPGGLVEVFENNSWKVATVSKVAGGNCYLVRLLGSPQEVRVHKSQIRVRQIWKGHGWVMVGKDLEVYEDEKSGSRGYLKSKCKVAGAGGKRKMYEEDVCFSRTVSSRTLKRESPNGLSYLEAYIGSGQKLRANEKLGRRQRMTAEHPCLLREKVDAVASPQYILGEKHMPASPSNQNYNVNTERVVLDGCAGCFSGRSLERSDAESSACSVGSCSINSGVPYRLPHCSLTNPTFDSDSHSSDAESFCGSGCEKEHPFPFEDVKEEIHKLELHAYCSTMGALYCSGPLSWEQEELVTNLRLMLHISNDEHLLVLRHLISVKKQ